MKYCVYIKGIKRKTDDSVGGIFFADNLIKICLIEAENKEEVKIKIAERYPELINNQKVYQKTTKNSNQLVYLDIFIADKYVLEKYETNFTCKKCGNVVNGLEYRNLHNKLPFKWDSETKTCYCSESCLNSSEMQITDDYYSDRCPVYSVYKITEKSTGKCYIGYSKNEVIFRWWSHLKHSKSPFGIYLQKEGIEKFTFEVIDTLDKKENKDDDAKKLETKYMLQYDSIENGFNSMISYKGE